MSRNAMLSQEQIVCFIGEYIADFGVCRGGAGGEGGGCFGERGLDEGWI